ncbi:MAG: oligosaccharide flippase family protein [Bacteroidota bacterium]
MDSSEYETIKGKIIVGVFALTTRTFLLQIITAASNLILAAILSPDVFGTYFITTAFIGFLGYFSDVGLSAALIQKKEEPTLSELRSAFTVQQLLVGALVVIGLLLTPLLGKWYNLDNSGLFLFQAFLISFFLSSLKTIPSLLLERKLAFQVLIIPQLLETVLYNGVAIVLALKGFGVISFAWAALARGIGGLVSIYIISPWNIGLELSFESIKHLLTYGIPMQVNSILALIKDNLITLFLGRILPLRDVGYIGWAKNMAELILRLIMDSVIRVTFPAYSRLQHDYIVLGKAIEKSLFFLAYFIFPVTALSCLFINPLIHIIPKYLKWEPALFSFYLFSFASVWACFSTPVVNALNAIRKVNYTLILMLLWTSMTWIFVPLFVHLFGYNGVAINAALIAVTGAIPLVLLKRFVAYSIIKPLLKPFFSTLVIIIPFVSIIPQPTSIISMVIILSAYGILYLSISAIWMNRELGPYVNIILRKMKLRFVSV